MYSVHDKKLCIMALCSLISIQESKMPAAIKDGLDHVVRGLSMMIKTLPEAEERTYCAFILYKERPQAIN